MRNPGVVVEGRPVGGRKTGKPRASGVSAARRSEIARVGGLARAQAQTPLERRELAHRAAVARWGRRPRVATAQDAPGAVRRLLRGYRAGALVWADPDHRYLIAWHILVRGDQTAVRWLRSQLRPSDIRDLVVRHRGHGCSEPEREKLRKKLRLTPADIPIRPY